MSHKRLNIGVTTAVYAPSGVPFPLVNVNIYDSIDWLSENGFDSIELHLRVPEIIERAGVKAYCEQKGLGISSIGTGMAAGYDGLILSHPEKEVRRKTVELLQRQLDLGAYLDAKVIIGSMRGTLAPGQSYAQVEQHSIEAMKQLADYAEKKDAYLAVEAIDLYETNYVNSCEEVLDWIDRIGSDHILVHLDTFHMNITEPDMEAAILKCGEKLGHLHLADNNRNYPGWGHIDFKGIIKALDTVNYTGASVIECFQVPDGRTAALRGLHYLRDLEKQL